MAKIIVKDLQDNSYQEDEINIVDENHFSYVDIDNNSVDIRVFNDGLIINKKAKDYTLLLNLVHDSYAEIKTCEDFIKLDAKIVAFSKNNDTILMRYTIETEDRVIEIKY